MLLLTLAMVIVSAGLVLINMSNRLNARIAKEVRTEATYLAAAIDRTGEDYLADVRNTPEANRITLVAADGRVVFDTAADPAQMENHLNRPEIAEALRNGSGESSRLSSTLGSLTFYHAKRLANGYVVRVANTSASIYAAAWEAAPVTAVIVAAIFLLTAWVAGRVTRGIVAPLNSLDLENPLENDVYDELAPLLTRMERQSRLIRQQIEDASRKQEEFTAITGNMREGLVVLDAKSIILSINKSALRMLGVRSGDHTGRRFLTVSRSRILREAIDRALSGEPAEADVTVGFARYQVMANPVKDGNTVSGVLVLLFDVTEKRAAEQMRREFSANVSHEMRTPLTSILGYAELIKSGLAKEDDVPMFAERIHSEASRLIGLITDIMRISQLDEGAPNMMKEEVDLLAIVQSVCNRVRPSAERREVTLVATGVSANVHGSRQILEEVVENLCDNAIKYNHKGGRVDVSVWRVDHGVVLTVADTGVGIPREHQERVFERFYRVNDGQSEASSGTGLGLSIVKHGVMYHNAKIDLESEPGKGTTIRVTFPNAE